MPRAVRRLLSLSSFCVLIATVAGCNLTTDDLSTPSPGDPCEEEGKTVGSLVCEDGLWVKEDGESDAGFDVGDAGPTEDVGDAGPTEDVGDAGPTEDVGDAGPTEDVDAGCEPGYTECGGECVDIETNDDHCGGCFQGCDENEHCGGALCKISDCPTGTEYCGGQCVDTGSDPDHCGDCDEACPDGDVCDGGECFECLDSGDCEGAAQCHDVYPVCIDECCDFVVEDVVTDVNISFDQLSIDVTGDGDPVIAFMDRDTDTIRIAERIGDNWYTQDVTTVSNSLSTRVRMVLDEDDNPHLVYRRFEEWKYYWRDGSTWIEEEVWDEELSSGYSDLVVDSQGTVHIVGDHGFPESHRVNYATYSPSGEWQREWFEEVDDDRNFNWMVVDVTSDDEPVVALAVWDSGVRDLFVARRQGGGSWTAEWAVADINQIMDMAVGPDDEVNLATVDVELPHDGLELTSDVGGSWQTETLNSRAEAFQPQVVIDHLGDPHVAFSDTEPDQSHRHLSYTRWDGTAWQTEDVSQSQIEWSQRQRIAVDGESVVHMAVYDGNRDTLSYVTVE